MTLTEFDKFCSALPGTSFVVQWGESHVHKVGGKLFALGNHDENGQLYFALKTTPLAYEMLLEQGLATRAPYLPRGQWVKIANTALKDAEHKAYLAESHRIIAARLTKALRQKLGLTP